MVRIATQDDSLDIAALSIQVWLDTYAKKGIRKAISNYVLTEFTEEKITRKIISKHNIYIVALRDDHLIGYVLINLSAPCPITSQPNPEIDRLYVQENFTAQAGITFFELENEKHKNLVLSKLFS